MKINLDLMAEIFLRRRCSSTSLRARPPTPGAGAAASYATEQDVRDLAGEQDNRS